MKKRLITAALLASAMATPMAMANQVKPEMTELKVCGALMDGHYYKAAGWIADRFNRDMAKRNLPVKAVQVENFGTLDIINQMKSGECDVGVVSGDGFAWATRTGKLPAFITARPGHTEAMHYIANKAHGKHDLADIEKDIEYRVVVVEDAGGQVFLQNIADQDSGYEVNLKNAIKAPDSYQAGLLAAQGFAMVDGQRVKVAGALVGIRPGKPESIQKIFNDFGKDLVLGSMTDGDFDAAKDADGNDLYYDVVIPKGTYKVEQSDSFGGQAVLGVRAQLVFNNDSTNGLDRRTKRFADRAMISAIAGVSNSMRNAEEQENQ
ncbi:hypothetical protein [Neptuniibacter sp. QD37_11]|uniref:hypothetical protein n=1 Tax=Neptuniibacter sp. QD37_11 TaxID=3398209 RepID=UPI0039F4E780